ncbi:MAG: ribbon-helix-helix protein, CopG family [Deltaproteobacteria bacterium]|nr:ribbon-helix-helix protein, CopG family [Deltaproteobacteria bacterium]
MKTLSLKLSESLLEKLDSTARRRGESRSALLREAIETVIEGENQISDGSCLDLAKDLAGCVNGPEDLSFNKRLMDGYGQ